jgi:hypothetical protein
MDKSGLCISCFARFPPEGRKPGEGASAEKSKQSHSFVSGAAFPGQLPEKQLAEGRKYPAPLRDLDAAAGR